MLHIQTKLVVRCLIWGLLVVIFAITQGCGWISSKEKTDDVRASDSAAVKAVPAENEAPVVATDTSPPSEIEKPAESKSAEIEENSPAQVIPAQPTATPDVAVQAMPIRPNDNDMPAPPTEELAMAHKGEASPSIVKPQVSLGPNHFRVTVATKDTTHPFYGKGHNLGFVVDGVQGKELVVERGKTYTFQVETDPKHDVYFSGKDIGWGSNAWVDGVEGQYIYQGTMSFKPNSNSPSTLYYACRNHPYMGGKIDVINAGEKVQRGAKKELTSEPTEGPVMSSQASGNATATMVNQKLMFADMLIKSKNSQRVSDSGITEAVAMQNKAVDLVALARKQLKEGAITPAFDSASQGLELLKQAARLVPSEEQLTEQKAQYAELSGSIKEFEKSHADNFQRISKKQGKDATVDYDKGLVEKLKQDAEKLAGAHDYLKANKLLAQAQHEVMLAIKKMLDSQTIVYDLKFESAAEEYEYELKRFGGYEELIPIAIEAKNPSKGSIQLMETYLQKGRDMRDTAKKKAASGDFPTAIAMMLDATTEVRRALRMVGVTQ